MGLKFHLVFFISSFILVFLINLIIDLINLKKKKYKNIGEIQYLIKRFKLSNTKMYKIKMCIMVSMINAIIISSTTTIVALIDAHLTIQLLIGFVMLFSLIYSLYEIIGRLLVRLGYKKKERGK